MEGIVDQILDGTYAEDLFNIGKFLAFAVIAGLLLGYVLILGVGCVGRSGFDQRVRRRWIVLRSIFCPRFVLEPFEAGDDVLLGKSLASLITDELSEAEPTSAHLDRATPDQHASVADSLAESSDYLKVLSSLRNRVLGMRRYVVRGTIHPPTDAWQSMTVEILSNDSRVLANKTFFVRRLQREASGGHRSMRGSAREVRQRLARRHDGDRDRTTVSAAPGHGDGVEAYQLVPLAASWIVFTLHEIFRFPSDRQWRKHRLDEDQRSKQRYGRRLVLVGTDDWESYGQFRRGYWMETIEQQEEARQSYIRALDLDRHNLGAFLNLVHLNRSKDGDRGIDRARLSMMIDKIVERTHLLVDPDVEASIRENARHAVRTLRSAPPGRDGPLIDLDDRQVDICLEHRWTWGRTQQPVCMSPLWFQWAYADIVARLHEHVGAGDGVNPSARESLLEARRTAIRLVQNTSLVLLTYREEHIASRLRRGLRAKPATLPQEDALINMCEASEFVGLTLLAAVENEIEFLDDVPAQPTPASEGTLQAHRWAYLIGFTSAHRLDNGAQDATRLDAILQMTEPGRPVSYKARFNLACMYSRRAEHLRSHRTRSPASDPSQVSSGSSQDSLEYEFSLLQDPDRLLDHSARHLEFACENTKIAAAASTDPSLEHLRNVLEWAKAVNRSAPASR